jgi:hypothetical protein
VFEFNNIVIPVSRLGNNVEPVIKSDNHAKSKLLESGNPVLILHGC